VGLRYLFCGTNRKAIVVNRIELIASSVRCSRLSVHAQFCNLGVCWCRKAVCINPGDFPCSRLFSKPLWSPTYSLQPDRFVCFLSAW